MSSCQSFSGSIQFHNIIFEMLGMADFIDSDALTRRLTEFFVSIVSGVHEMSTRIILDKCRFALSDVKHLNFAQVIFVLSVIGEFFNCSQQSIHYFVNLIIDYIDRESCHKCKFAAVLCSLRILQKIDDVQILALMIPRIVHIRETLILPDVITEVLDDFVMRQGELFLFALDPQSEIMDHLHEQSKNVKPRVKPDFSATLDSGRIATLSFDPYPYMLPSASPQMPFATTIAELNANTEGSNVSGYLSGLLFSETSVEQRESFVRDSMYSYQQETGCQQETIITSSQHSILHETPTPEGKITEGRNYAGSELLSPMFLGIKYTT